MPSAYPAMKFPVARAEFPALVLIVDSEPLVCWALTMGLRLAGFDAVAAATARDAVARAAARPAPTVILMDAGMRECDPLVLTSALHYAAPAARIVALATGDEPRGCTYGIGEVIYKPFDLPEVVAAINRIASVR